MVEQINKWTMKASIFQISSDDMISWYNEAVWYMITLYTDWHITYLYELVVLSSCFSFIRKIYVSCCVRLSFLCSIISAFSRVYRISFSYFRCTFKDLSIMHKFSLAPQYIRMYLKCPLYELQILNVMSRATYTTSTWWLNMVAPFRSGKTDV